MISLEGIRFGYTRQKPLFNGFSWTVQAHESWAVVGPSGCGKSTLLYLLAGLRLPESGPILINGIHLNRPRPETGLILQDYGLLPWATVEQNANLGIAVRNFYGPDGTHAPTNQSHDQSSAYWVDRLGIREIAGQYPAQISGGQRQRTAIARTLALKPDLLLMDEPFSSVDASTRSDLQNLIIQLCQENQLTMIVVTHSIEEAAILGQRILFLGNPTHTSPVVLDNPHSNDPSFAQTDQYFQICKRIREYLESA
jgi:ABC-type nitrate/sulfonate/bicarbonate transport system ATPase subunit